MTLFKSPQSTMTRVSKARFTELFTDSQIAYIMKEEQTVADVADPGTLSSDQMAFNRFWMWVKMAENIHLQSAPIQKGLQAMVNLTLITSDDKTRITNNQPPGG